MAYAAGTLGTTSTTVLTPAMVWGAMPTSIYGTSAGMTAAGFVAGNMNTIIAAMNAAMAYADQYQLSTEIATEYSTAGAQTGVFAPANISEGILYYPSRGWLKLYPGDVIAVDPNTGWPIVINAQTALPAGGLGSAGTSSWHVVPNT